MGRIVTVGSINADYLYLVPHLPGPGETLASTGMRRSLGGKGANQSIAAARSGAEVAHVGCIGPGDDWLTDTMAAAGVDVAPVTVADVPTGHAIIAVDPAGENSIILASSANLALDPARIAAVLEGHGLGDICLLQNEINATAEAAALARARGLTVVYSAAPFDPAAVEAVLPHADLLVMNAVEAAQLGRPPAALGVDVLVTKGAEGATYHGDEVTECPAFAVTPVDTTGAGDCYIGSFAAKRALGADVAQAMRWAAAASAIQVTRIGTADAMPTADEIAAFLAERG